MKILQVTPSFYPAWIYGGPTRSVYHLSCALGAAGGQVRVLTTDANGARPLAVVCNTDMALSDAVNVRYCRRVALNSVSPRLLWELKAAAWADIIHLQGAYSFPTFFALAQANHRNKPLVWSPRGAFGHWRGSRRPTLKRLWRKLCRQLAPQNLTLHATSPHERDHIDARWPDAHIRIVPNGVHIPPPPPFEPPQRATAADLQLLFMGRLAPIKGLERLLEACAQLSAGEVGRWHLTIAGAGAAHYERRLRGYAAALGIGEQTTFLGLVSGQQRRDCYHAAHVTIVPSHREAFSMVVIESLAHGVPVIASRHTPWRALHDRRCGLWVDNHAQALTNAITSINKMPLSDMGARGRSWVSQHFNWPSIAKQMLNVYAEALKRP